MGSACESTAAAAMAWVLMAARATRLERCSAKPWTCSNVTCWARLKLLHAAFTLWPCFFFQLLLLLTSLGASVVCAGAQGYLDERGCGRGAGVTSRSLFPPRPGLPRFLPALLAWPSCLAISFLPKVMLSLCSCTSSSGSLLPDPGKWPCVTFIPHPPPPPSESVPFSSHWSWSLQAQTMCRMQDVAHRRLQENASNK